MFGSAKGVNAITEKHLKPTAEILFTSMLTFKFGTYFGPQLLQ